MKGVEPAQIIQALLQSPKHLKELARWPDDAVASAFLGGGYDVRFVPLARLLAAHVRRSGRTPDVSVLRLVIEEQDPDLYQYKLKAALDEVEATKVTPALREHILANVICQLRLNRVLDSIHSTAFIEKVRDADVGGVIEDLAGAIKGLKGPSESGEVDPFAAYESFARGVQAVREEGDPTYFHMFIPGAVHSLAGASEAGKSSLAWWLAAHWATGEPPFAQWKPKDGDGNPNPGRCRVPAMGFSVYVGRDLDGRELQRKAARFGDAGLTATTRANPRAKQPTAMGGERLFAMTLDGPHAKQLVKIDASEEGIDQLIDLVQVLRNAYLAPVLRDEVYIEESSRLAEHVAGVRSELLAAEEYAEAEALDAEVAARGPLMAVPDPIPLIVLDSMATFAPPKVEETDNFAMTRVYDQLRRLAAQTRGVVLVLNHVSKADVRGGEFPPDILTFARGGTAQGAAARVNMALAGVPKTDGRILWLGVTSNSFPRHDLYLEVRPPERERGLHYFRLVDEATVQAIQAAAKAADPGPAPAAAWAALGVNAGQEFTMAQLKRKVASLWLNKNGRPRNWEDDKVEALALDLASAWIEEGRIEAAGKAQSGSPKFLVR